MAWTFPNSTPGADWQSATSVTPPMKTPGPDRNSRFPFQTADNTHPVAPVRATMKSSGEQRFAQAFSSCSGKETDQARFPSSPLHSRENQHGQLAQLLLVHIRTSRPTFVRVSEG